MEKILIYFLTLTVFPEVVFSQSDSTSIPVEFSFYKILQPTETGVGINGSFNNWGNNSDGTGNNKHLIPMSYIGNDNWKAMVNIQPGKYEYKFVTYSLINGDTVVSTWITDPLNSDFGGPYNNSRITVADPMIYYLLPMNGTTTNNPQTISAKISWAKSSNINLSTLQLILDNISLANAKQYFDTTSRTFSYSPSQPFTFAQHSAEISISNNKGSAADLITNFIISNAITKAPYRFVFDPLSPNLKLVGKINKVEIKGTFNNFGADPMTGPDSDGVYTYSVPLNVGVSNSYQYIINGGQYVDDPDNPVMGSDFGTIAVKRVNSNPYFEVLSPRQGELISPGSIVTVETYLMESDSGYVINNSSVKIFLDGNEVSVSSIDSIKSGVDIKSVSFNISAGRHQLKFVGADETGNQTQYLMTFGSFNANTGFHYVDADNDDNGPGNYKYPSFSSIGSADIKQIDINSNSTNDSLIFTISLAAVTDFTRIGFEILNSLNTSLSLAPDKAGIQIPDISNKGIFFILTPPNSVQKSIYLNKIYDNLLLNSSIDTLLVNANVESSDSFKFSIPISLIENAVGSFSKGWYFLAYSYLGNSNGGWKVSQSYGGSLFAESPNVYDAVFFFNNSIEKRNLSDYNFSFNYGGSRYVKLASNLRGVLYIRPQDISPSLASKPFVNILTNGGNIRWGDTVRVYVANSDSSITSGVLNDNSTGYNLTFINDTAYTDIVLSEGSNELQAYIDYGQNLKSYSPKVFFNRILDHKPSIQIVKDINSGSAYFDASGTTNHDNFAQSFHWSQDKKNPQQILFSSQTSSSTSFSIPQKLGEYFYTLTCSTSKDTSFERVALIVDSSGAYYPDLNTWHASWIDSARIYEIYLKTLSLDGNLAAATRRIPYIKSLGVNAVWLMPIYPGPPLSPSQPGYAISDYFNVNPSYGTLSDFKTFVDSAHANGLKVILDYVVDHTSNIHPFMLDAFKYGSKSPYHDFYGWNADGTYKYLYTWTDLPFIEFGSQKNRNYLLDAAKFWLENFNIDGFRCDAAAEVNDLHSGGAEFWQQFRDELKTIKPDVLLLGELNATNLDYFDKKFDSGYDYPFYDGIKNAISNINLLSSLKSSISQYETLSFPSYIVPFRYIENHDQARFISQYNLQETKLAATVLLTLPPLPMIYAGQEVGETSYRGLINWTDPNNLTTFYKKLISIREKFKALSLGKYKEIPSSSPDSIFAFARLSDTLSALVVSNFSSASKHFSLNLDSLHLTSEAGKEYYFNDVLNDVVYPYQNNSLFAMSVSSYTSAILIYSDTAFVTSIASNKESPKTYSLEQNYPNPFNPSTVIRYSVGGFGAAQVTMIIYNILGQKIKTLVDEVETPGQYQVYWNGINNENVPVSSGIYFYSLRIKDFVKTKKMILLK